MHLWITYNRLLFDCFLIIHMLCYPLTSSYTEMLLPLRLFFFVLSCPSSPAETLTSPIHRPPLPSPTLIPLFSIHTRLPTPHSPVPPSIFLMHCTKLLTVLIPLKLRTIPPRVGEGCTPQTRCDCRTGFSPWSMKGFAPSHMTTAAPADRKRGRIARLATRPRNGG